MKAVPSGSSVWKHEPKGTKKIMNYVGIDIHKKYSVLCAQDERGRTLREARIDGNSTDGFVQFFKALEGPSKAPRS